MQMRIVLVVLTAMVVACQPDRGPTVRASLNETERSSIAVVPGTIKVRLRWGNKWEQQRILQLQRGELAEGSFLTEPIAEESWRVSGGATMLSIQPPGTSYSGPYAFSRDRTRVAASFTALQQTEPPSRVAMVDLSSKRVVGEIAGPNGAFVHGLTWAPDSTYLALLLLRPERAASSPLATLSGHPPAAATFLLVIFDRESRKVAEFEIASKLPGGAAEVVWHVGAD